MRPDNRVLTSEDLEYLIRVHTSGGGVSGITTGFVYQPGGSAGGNVYTTWPTLMTAVAAVAGLKTILIDASFTAGDAHVPAGTSNVDNCTIVCRNDVVNGSDTLVFDEGAHLTFGILFLGTGFYECNSSTPVFTLPAGHNAEVFGFQASITSNAGKAPFFRSPATTFLFIGLNENSTLGDGTTPAYDLTTTVNSQISVSNLSTLDANAVIGAGTLQIIFDSSAVVGTQSGVGTVTNTVRSLASQEAYTPAVPGNWSPTPTLVAPALDQLAARPAGATTLAGDTHGPVGATLTTGLHNVVNWQSATLDTGGALSGGAATPPPANPETYVTITINGVTLFIPAYHTGS